MGLMRRGTPQGLAARYAADEELTVRERAVLLEAIATDQVAALESDVAMNALWQRAHTIKLLCEKFVESMFHRRAIAAEAEKHTPAPRPALRLVKESSTPSRVVRFVTDWLGGGSTGRGGAA